MYWLLGVSIYLAMGCFVLALYLAAERVEEQAEPRHDEQTER